MNILTTRIVGSTLHGLDNEHSDIDTVTVACSPLADVLSPFKSQKHKQQLADGNDHTVFEFSHFMKLVCGGNASTMEIVYSDRAVVTSSLWEQFRAARPLFLNKEGIYQSHKHYAHAQMERIWSEGIDSRRGRKAATAYIRNLAQGTDLLLTGEVNYPVSGKLYSTLYSLKNKLTSLDRIAFEELAVPWQIGLDEAYVKSTLTTADLSLAENFIERAYTGEY